MGFGLVLPAMILSGPATSFPAGPEQDWEDHPTRNSFAPLSRKICNVKQQVETRNRQQSWEIRRFHWRSIRCPHRTRHLHHRSRYYRYRYVPCGPKSGDSRTLRHESRRTVAPRRSQVFESRVDRGRASLWPPLLSGVVDGCKMGGMEWNGAMERFVRRRPSQPQLRLHHRHLFVWCRHRPFIMFPLQQEHFLENLVSNLYFPVDSLFLLSSFVCACVFHGAESTCTGVRHRCTRYRFYRYRVQQYGVP
jgi:hypothetical protein